MYDPSGFDSIRSNAASGALGNASQMRDDYMKRLGVSTIQGMADVEAARQARKAALDWQRKQDKGGFLGGLGSFLGAAAPFASLIPGVGPAAAAGGALIGNAAKKIG